MIANLKQREKIAIGAGVACVTIFLFLQIILFPLLNEQKRLKNAWQYKIETLEEIHALKAEFDLLQQTQRQMEVRFGRRAKEFSLYSFVERSANQAGLEKNNIVHMKPNTTKSSEDGPTISSVEIKLQDVALKQLVTYLYRLETSPNMVSIHRMAIDKTGKRKDRLTVNMQVQTMAF